MLIDMKDFIKFVLVYLLVCLSWILIVVVELANRKSMAHTVTIMCADVCIFATELLLIN